MPMAKLEKIDVLSWKQLFKDRKKELTLWSTHKEVAQYCNLKDKNKRLLQIQFEKNPELDVIDLFQITSGKEIRFPTDYQNLIGPVIFNNPDSYFIVRVLDTTANIQGANLKSINTTGSATIETRIGQNKFRIELINYWGCCAVTGIDLIEILKASHIKPWSESNDDERVDKYNGLLLNPMLDALFDIGYISFSDSGDILLSPRVPELNSILGIYEKGRLRKIEEQHMVYLKYHRENVFLE